jgi:predicted pyridoxine 5'-phosphate oxidase superfamily flavin-nucleotide-binding protein
VYFFWRKIMARAFADITFTPGVKAAQSLYHSREHNRGFELAEDPRNLLNEIAVAFIAERDSFYQATVAENGWPYMQHRGGPKGFLKVLDEHTLGYADFRGNRQYLSVGNIMSDARICLFLMDYANRRRLKIWGHASVVHHDDSPEIISQLTHPDYKASIERAIIIRVDALEWNCSKHITQRFNEDEVRQILQPLIEENDALKARLAQREQ